VSARQPALLHRLSTSRLAESQHLHHNHHSLANLPSRRRSSESSVTAFSPLRDRRSPDATSLWRWFTISLQNDRWRLSQGVIRLTAGLSGGTQISMHDADHVINSH
jgi:hypothetical protein